MRLRIFSAAAAIAVTASFPLAGVAAAQADRDCPDFATQAEAQAALDSRIGDPERLDADDDGYACESQFGEPGGSSGDSDDSDGDPQISTVPKGGVDTGDGSSSGDPVPTVLLIGGVAVLGLGAARVARLSR